MDAATLTKCRAMSEANANTVMANIEECFSDLLSEETWDSMAQISNILADMPDTITPRELVHVLRESGFNYPYQFVYHSVFYTVSRLICRNAECRLENGS